MNKKIVLSIAAVVLAAAVVILAVYLRPQSFAACSDFDPERATQVSIILSPNDSQESLEFTLTAADPEYQTLIDLLNQQQYRRNFPPSHRGRTSALDHSVFLNFNDGTSPFYFYGNKILTFIGDISDVTIAGLTTDESIAFQQEILDLLLDAAARREAAA